VAIERGVISLELVERGVVGPDDPVAADDKERGHNHEHDHHKYVEHVVHGVLLIRAWCSAHEEV
jgi:hypothetical protein